MKQIDSTTWATETDGGKYLLVKGPKKSDNTRYAVLMNRQAKSGEPASGTVTEVVGRFRYKANAIKYITGEQNKAAYDDRKAKYEAGLEKFKQGQAKVFVNVVQLETELVNEVGFESAEEAKQWMNENIFQYNPRNGYTMQLAA